MVAAAIAAAGDGDQVRHMAEAAARLIVTSGTNAATEAYAAIDDPARARQLAEQAEAAARSHTAPGRQVWLLALHAQAFAAAGDRARARQFAEQAAAAVFASGPSSAPEAMTAVAQAFAADGDPDRAVAAAYSITSPHHRERALRVVAGMFVAAGDPDRVIAVACASAYLNDQAEILTAVAEAIAAAGDTDKAETVARLITYPYWQVLGLAAVARSITAAGRPGLARQHAERAMVAARSLTHWFERTEALTAVAKAADAAAAVERRAEEILLRRNHRNLPYEQAQELAAVVHAITVGDPDRASRTMGAMLASTSWDVPLLVLAKHWPQVVLRCVDALSGNERSRDTQNGSAVDPDHRGSTGQ